VPPVFGLSWDPKVIFDEIDHCAVGLITTVRKFMKPARGLWTNMTLPRVLDDGGLGHAGSSGRVDEQELVLEPDRVLSRILSNFFVA